MITKIIRSVISPSMRLHYHALNTWFYGEREMHYLKRLCDPNKASIDVGASTGVYSYYLRRYTKKCYAFEPNPIRIDFLKHSFKDSIYVYPFALSNHNGITKINIPVVNGIKLNEFATLEDDNCFHANCEIFEVEARCLDYFGLKDIGFIKIDVEGHEFALLQGAVNTLKQEKPSLIIEAEERHKHGTVEMVTAFLTDIGYNGYFLLNKKLHPISEFDLSRHQLEPLKNNMEQYIFNFIFINSST